jgi:hypothetical protein
MKAERIRIQKEAELANRLKREKEERFQLLATNLDVRPLSFPFLSFPFLSWIISCYLLTSTLEPRPSTLNPRPSTLNLEP